MEKYRFLEGLTYADYAFEAFGKSLSELFVNAAIALCACQAELSTVDPVQSRAVKMTSNQIDQLLFDFLEEIVFVKDAESFLCSRVEAKVTRTSQGFRVAATLFGEEIQTKKHQLHNDIKSVTYHLFKVEQISDGWRAQVILDV